MNIITALITPFDENLNVDYVTLKNLIDFQEQSTVDGLLVLGTTSESFSLSLKEKIKICKLVFSNFTRTKMICIEGNTPQKIIDQIDNFKSFNPDYFLITPPYFNKGDQMGLVDYFLQIADYSPSPIIIYNIPSRSGFDIDFDVVKIISKHKNIHGVKNASFDIHYNLKISTLSCENFYVFSGNDELLLENLCLNNQGCISVISNIIPSYLSTIKSDKTYGKKNFKYLIPLLMEMNKATNPLPIKKLMAKKNIIKKYIRPPFSNTNPLDFSFIDERNILDEYFTNR